jgi:anti-sigma regulatory factor (Ser/Thr protein kinase)
VAEAGQAWGLPDAVIESAQLATSELVSNSVEHGLSSVEITLELDGDCRLRIAVRDNSHAFPVLHPPGATGPRGRGMALVEALADVWGVTPHPDGKTIWLQLPAPHDLPASLLERPQMPQVSERLTE